MKYLILVCVLFLACAPDIVPTSGQIATAVIEPEPEPVEPINHIIKFEVTTNKEWLNHVIIHGNNIFLDCETGKALNWFREFEIPDESDYFTFDFFGLDDGSMTLFHTSIYLDGVLVADWRTYTENKKRLEFAFKP